MRAVQRQDKSAFQQLMTRHLDSLYSYAIRLTRDTNNAEDLVQETWSRVWSNGAKYTAGKAKFSTWLYRILYNVFVDQYRRHQQPAAAMADAQGHDELSDLQANEQLKERLDCALKQLSSNQRAALLLFHQQGFSTREVANIMHINVRAAESLLVRARRALRVSLTQEIGNEENMP